MAAVRRTYGNRGRETTPLILSDAETPPTSQLSAPDDLTPRSRVKRMLAAIDASSDEDDDEDIPLPGMSAKQSPYAEFRGPKDRAEGGSALLIPGLTCMNATNRTVEQDSADTETDAAPSDHNSTYHRIRTQLMHASREDGPVAAQQEDVDVQKGVTSVAGIQRPRQITPNAPTVRERLNGLAQRKRMEASASDEIVEQLEISMKGVEQTSGSDSEDIEAQIRMSSVKRAPRRNASKKALEEMHRETERIQRGMTLAPEAHVKRRLEVTSFLSKLGYHPRLRQELKPSPDHSMNHESGSPSSFSSSTTSPLAVPAVAAMESPIAKEPVMQGTSAAFATALEESEGEAELPDVESLTQVGDPLMIVPAHNSSSPVMGQAIHEDVLLDSSDSDAKVELPARLKSHKLLFAHRNAAQIKKDRRSAKFVAMARPESPSKVEARAEKARKSALLIAVAREAKAERSSREAALKAAGVKLLTATERQKEAIEVEDLVDKARRQAEQLRKLEKQEDQKRKAAEDGTNFASSSDDDGDWDGESEHDIEDGMLSELLSDTSDDADTETDCEANEETKSKQEEIPGHPVVQRTVSILSERCLEDDEESLQPVSRKLQQARARSRRIIAGEDSEDDKENTMPIDGSCDQSQAGLTQFFASTQADDCQAGLPGISASQFCLSPQDAPDVMRCMRYQSTVLFDQEDTCGSPPFLVPAPTTTTAEEEPTRIVSSQPEYEMPGRFVATQFSIFDPPSPDQPVDLYTNTEDSDTQATQVDTNGFVLDEDNQTLTDAFGHDDGTPVLHRLRRSQLSKATQPDERTVNKFRKQRADMNEEQHQKSRKAFLDDRAVESDDEYAGLGGASDEDPEDAAGMATELADMIDNEAHSEDEDEQQRVAAFHAKANIENDEKLLKALMSDINNGGLRRRKGAGLLDMDDSEDEEEEEARYKARQALMRTRLLESHNLTALADNPKTKAFIEALEDKPASDCYIEIAGEVDDEIVPETQPEVHSSRQGSDEANQEAEPQMPPPSTSTTFKRPSKKRTALDVRNELSFLREDDNECVSVEDFNPFFVPTLKRERSSLSIDDRSHASLSRENSQQWRDPRTEGSQTSGGSSGDTDSLYAQLGKARIKSDAEDAASAPGIVVVTQNGSGSRGSSSGGGGGVWHGGSTFSASRMATKAVNYHAKAARVLRDRKERDALMQAPRKRKAAVAPGAEGALTASAKKDARSRVMKLFM